MSVLIQKIILKNDINEKIKKCILSQKIEIKFCPEEEINKFLEIIKWEYNKCKLYI